METTAISPSGTHAGVSTPERAAQILQGTMGLSWACEDRVVVLYGSVLCYSRVIYKFEIDSYSKSLLFIKHQIEHVPAINPDAYPMDFKPLLDLNIAPVSAPAVMDPI